MSRTFQSNINEVNRALQQAQERALDTIGFHIEGKAQLRSPVKTGNLKGSINYKIRGNEVKIGTNVEYALSVEKGTYRQEAQPYLTPAAEESQNDIKELVRRAYSQLD